MKFDKILKHSPPRLLRPPSAHISKQAVAFKKLCIYGNGQLIDPAGFHWRGENLFTLATREYFSSPSSQAFL